MKFGVALRGTVEMRDEATREIRPPTSEELEEFLDEVMEELVRLEAMDISMGTTLSSGQVDITVGVDAPGPIEAVSTGTSYIRSAIHAAGGHTPGWEIDWESVQALRSVVESDPDHGEALVSA